ncbi:MAG: WD40/YVTN/BNR-like repeat-containing protein [Crocinitomicaceae bacterium]
MSEDNGETLPLVPTYLSGELVLSLAYSAPYLYAGTEEGLLYKIDQTGGIAEITGPWNGDKPTAIHNILYAGNSIIVGLSGAEQDTLHNLNGGVWQSIDDGETWVDITGNMTNTNVFGNTGLAIDENGNVLAATYGLGIFQSNDLFFQWMKLHETLILAAFQIRPRNEFLSRHCLQFHLSQFKILAERP